MLSKPIAHYDDAELQGLINLCASELERRRAASSAASVRRRKYARMDDRQVSDAHGVAVGAERDDLRAELAERNAKRRRLMELDAQGGGQPGKESGVGFYKGGTPLDRPARSASQTIGPTYGQ